MAKKAAHAAETQVKQDNQMAQAQMDSVHSKVDGVLETIGLLNERLSSLEQNVSRMIPRDSLVPADVWSQLGHENVIASAISGSVQGIMSNVPLHNLNKKVTQELFADMVFQMAETILLKYGERMNQTVKAEETSDGDDS